MPRIARKRSLEQPEDPRPMKRLALSSGNVDTDKSVVFNTNTSKVDIAIAKHLKTYRLDRDKLDTVNPDQKANILSDIFRIIVIQSRGKLDPNLEEMIDDDEYADRWNTFAEAHPGLSDILLECLSLDPPSFKNILELGSFIAKLKNLSD